MDHYFISQKPLTLEDLVSVARDKRKVALGDDVLAQIDASSQLVKRFIDEERTIYGITTGFGKFSDIRISKRELKDLQRNLIISHSTGVGEALADDIVRAMILLRINALSKGHSGIRRETLEQLIFLLNEDIIPWIPEKGSLGASGDLAPLAHMVAVLLGEGQCKVKGQWMKAEDMLKQYGREAWELQAKEGLALINGTQVMTAIGALTLYDAKVLFEKSCVVSAITFETLRGITDVLDPRLHELRAHPGQIAVAAKLTEILKGSKLTTRQGELRVQDAYSLRCTPQVLGASLDALHHVEEKMNIEMNAVTDNPILFQEDEVAISGGNFHGQPMALAFDYLGIALSEIGNIAERRIERLVNPALSGLPAFLTTHGGLHSGFMIAQYSAAALVSENKVLSHPASVDSIPSSANQEDHVSMGTIAARKAREILFNVENIIAIELLCSCQGIDIIQGYDDMAERTKELYQALRKNVAWVDEDRFLAEDIVKARALIIDGRRL